MFLLVKIISETQTNTNVVLILVVCGELSAENNGATGKMHSFDCGVGIHKWFLTKFLQENYLAFSLEIFNRKLGFFCVILPVLTKLSG